MFEISGKIMQISLKDSISAVIDISGAIDFSEFGNSLPLDQALQEALFDNDACFICAYDTTFLALKHGQDLFLFDSHARNELGLKHSDGKSLLLKLSSLNHLYQYCCSMIAGSSEHQWFEVTGVTMLMFREDELPESHERMNTSDHKLPEIRKTESKKTWDLPIIQDDLTLS
ncbi:unnamed protein product [Mytilus coruscus]|uniref:Uncharacterized protein n=1 Tax=Mytilus coruscus TaxID=42192 RepID=A0A6J8ALB5_MYTCO|nr:unnamed protein product [Mytilus coruscus]